MSKQKTLTEQLQTLERVRHSYKGSFAEETDLSNTYCAMKTSSVTRYVKMKINVSERHYDDLFLQATCNKNSPFAVY